MWLNWESDGVLMIKSEAKRGIFSNKYNVLLNLYRFN